MELSGGCRVKGKNDIGFLMVQVFTAASGSFEATEAANLPNTFGQSSVFAVVTGVDLDRIESIWHILDLRTLGNRFHRAWHSVAVVEALSFLRASKRDRREIASSRAWGE